MMNRIFVFSDGEYYHIYNRGVDKRQIFINNIDHLRFVVSIFTSREGFFGFIVGIILGVVVVLVCIKLFV
ncbi:MAG: hypothetical protein WCW14_02605 [Candidatus Paceibacterota bacterium]|jgi:hypothetical protein